MAAITRGAITQLGGVSSVVGTTGGVTVGALSGLPGTTLGE